MITDPAGTVNGDDNFVPYNYGHVYFMPSGTADPTADVLANTSPNQVISNHAAGGRTLGRSPVRARLSCSPACRHYARGRSILNLVGRAGQLSTTASARLLGWTSPTCSTTSPRDAADDNFNSFDPYPPVSATYNRLGEVNDLDFLDPAGAYLLPVERMRRYLAPADINGTGHVLQWNNTQYATGSLSSYDLGGDQWGRVVYYSYFRPPGLPGQVVLPGGT